MRSSPSLDRLHPQSILVIKPSALGDVVQSLPLLPALRKRFPAARISWVINSDLANLLEHHPLIDELITYERHGSLRAWLGLLGRLRQCRFDLVLDLQGLLRTGLMTAATGASLKIGIEAAREGSWLSCHQLVPGTRRGEPAHQIYARVTEFIGGRYVADQVHVTPDNDDHAVVDSLLRRAREQKLAVQPGAKWVTKRWPVERFADVTVRAAERFGLTPVVLGSPSERPLCEQLEQLVRQRNSSIRCVNLAGATTLRQLAVVLKSCAISITNDSGPMHLAAAVGTPVVSVFLCTDSVRSGPTGDQHELVSTRVSCNGSYRRKCPHFGDRHMACMHELDTERVWSAVLRLMKKNSLDGAAA